jgi:hypothetical protein
MAVPFVAIALVGPMSEASMLVLESAYQIAGHLSLAAPDNLPAFYHDTSRKAGPDGHIQVNIGYSHLI